LEPIANVVVVTVATMRRGFTDGNRNEECAMFGIKRFFFQSDENCGVMIIVLGDGSG